MISEYSLKEESKAYKEAADHMGHENSPVLLSTVTESYGKPIRSILLG